MREQRCTQREGEDLRRWFHGERADLYVWSDALGIRAFEFCYGKPHDEHALRWTRDAGFDHVRIDDGEANPAFSRTPVAVADGDYSLADIAETFRRHAAGIDSVVAGFVLDRLLHPEKDPEMSASRPPLFETSLKSLPFLHRGKVRDIYAVGEDRLLVVQTDRLSAFDVILPTPVPGKGEVLTRMSLFWFAKLGHVIPNHLTGTPPESVVAPEERDQVVGRAMVVRRLRPLMIEAVVRGYLAGSGWKDYRRSGAVCGIALPPGLREADRLPQPIFTPATKAPAGSHDENIGFEEAARIVGATHARQVRDASLQLYSEAAAYAETRGIIIADTKFEFGLDAQGNVVLIDEILTADSSRFWPKDQYAPGASPPSFDKQFVRDWLETQNWNKKPPAPALPPDILAKTAEKYREALRRLTR